MTIYDSAKGISFKEKESSKETFLINSQGLYAGDGDNRKHFLKIDNNGQVSFNIDQISASASNSLGSLSLAIEGNIPVLLHRFEGNNTNSCGFYFEQAKTSFKMNDEEKIIFSELLNELKGKTVLSSQVEGTTIKMSYEATNNGYNLFVL